jgi:hypothetical protein
VLLDKLAVFTRELGHFPLRGELRRKARLDESFPADSVWSRTFGEKGRLVDAVRDHCQTRPDWADVVRLLPDAVVSATPRVLPSVAQTTKASTGFVYLMKSGRHYKVGHTKSVARREYELGIKILIPPKVLHKIETSDPAGVEAYWHNRFRDKRGEGEWFNLDASEVDEFKRWRQIV